MRKALILVLLAGRPLAADVKVYKAKHRPADSLHRVIRTAVGGADVSPQFNTITLHGSAEAIKAAEAILEQYDTPRRQAEFLLRVIEAGGGAQGPNDAAELVPAELKSMLKYTRFTLLDSAVVRGMEAESLRLALGGNLSGKLSYTARDSAVEVDVTGPPMNIKNSAGNDTTHFPSILTTTATVKSGETVVLGASKMRSGSSALIVLLTAKLLP
jgi:hypothetical protein